MVRTAVAKIQKKLVIGIASVNPVAHFAAIARDVLVKGSGLEIVYPHLLALAGIAALLVGISASRFRRQLSA